jgi:hypothetical protein
MVVAGDGDGAGVVVTLLGLSLARFEWTADDTSDEGGSKTLGVPSWKAEFVVMAMVLWWAIFVGLVLHRGIVAASG